MANLKVNKDELAFLQIGLIKIFEQDKEMMKQIKDTVGEAKILETGMTFMKIQVAIAKGEMTDADLDNMFGGLLKKVFEVKENGDGTKKA